MSTRKRNFSLDALRILACIMVVLEHSPMPAYGTSSFLIPVINLFCAPCVGIFFMISGALLLPVKTPTVVFLKKHISKLAYPLIFWSLAYMLLKYLCRSDVPSIINILSIPFSVQGTPILWFLYTMIGLYLIAPVLSAWLREAKWADCMVYIALFVLAFCTNILSLWLVVDKTFYYYIYYFTGFTAYFVGGWFMLKFSSRIRLWPLIIGYLAAIIAAIVCKLFVPTIDFYEFFWQSSITTLVAAFFWFKLFTMNNSFFEKLKDGTKKILVTLSNLSFGVYLIHYAVIHFLLWELPFIQHITLYPLQIFVIVLLTLIISTLLSYIISRFKIGKYIIGYTVAF